MGRQPYFIIFASLILLLVSPALGYTDCDGIEDGDVVLMSYTAEIRGGDRDGEQFDTGTRVQFTISENSLIEGFYEGALGMKVGERKEIVVPPEKGYSSGDLAGQTLVFDTTLDEIVEGERDCGSSGTDSQNTEPAINLDGSLSLPLFWIVLALVTVPLVTNIIHRDTKV
jgi:hypothetical protein